MEVINGYNIISSLQVFIQAHIIQLTCEYRILVSIDIPVSNQSRIQVSIGGETENLNFETKIEFAKSNLRIHSITDCYY